MNQLTNRSTVLSLVAAVFVTGLVIANISSEHFNVYLLKPAFSNDSTRAVITNIPITVVPLYSTTSNTFNVHTNCSNLTTPRVGPNEDTWQQLSRTNNKVFVYSAFLDKGVVSLVGITDKPSLHATCQLWYKHEKNYTVYMLTAPAEMVKIPGGEHLPFTTKYFQCAAHHSWSPFAVSLVSGNDVCASPSNVLHVYQPMPDNDKMFNFTICVPPVRGIYPKAQRLIEWIEMNRLLGVQFFTFYNESIFDGVEHIFKEYEKQGVLEILHWNRPMVDIHYGAQIASMHDCLNRHTLRRSKYTSFLDIDEMIIPHSPEDFTWEDMLSKLTFACSYSFKCSFFPGNYTGESVSNDTSLSMNRSYILNNINRHEHIFRHRDRSKLITRPNEVQFMGTHLTYACKRGQKTQDVDASIGMLHHYRNQPGSNNMVRDNTTLKYKSLLEERLRKVYTLFTKDSMQVTDVIS